MMATQPADAISSLLPLRHHDAAPLHRQLYDGLRRAILGGQLPPGARLPSSRALASELHLSRTTVLDAYQQLLAEGYLEGRRGSGTYIASRLAVHRPAEAGANSANVAAVQNAQPHGEPQLSRRGRAWLAESRATAPYFAIDADDAPVGRAFRLGLPALDAFPQAIWSRLLGRRSRSSARAMLTSHPGGYQPLRQAIASYLGTARGVRCTADQVIVVNGSQQALDLAARVLLNPGDAAWIEDPGYLGARTALLGAEAALIPVPIADDGFDLDTALARYADARLAYITPSHQFPLGRTMSLSRRLALLAWANTAQGWILEDDYDSEFRYSGRPLAALQGLAEYSRVVYLGTFSKVLAPTLRLGYVVAPPALVEPLLAALTSATVHPPMLEQAVLADFIAEGHFARHLRRMRQLYAERQTVLLSEARHYLSGMMTLEPDDAGLHLVGWLADGLDDRALARRAAEQAGIYCYPLSLFCLEPLPRKALLLGYAAPDSAEIREGVRRLARIDSSSMSSAPGRSAFVR